MRVWGRVAGVKGFQWREFLATDDSAGGTCIRAPPTVLRHDVRMSPRAQPLNAPVTLAQLAQELGVHVSTVSRALSDDPVGVGSETVEKIRTLALHRGYRRNVAAQSLRTGRTRMIGVMVPRLTDVVMATIYEGIDEAAIVAGYNTVVANTQDRPELQRSRLDLMLSRGVDGLIVGDSRSDSNLISHQLRVHVTPSESPTCWWRAGCRASCR